MSDTSKYTTPLNGAQAPNPTNGQQPHSDPQAQLEAIASAREHRRTSTGLKIRCPSRKHTGDGDGFACHIDVKDGKLLGHCFSGSQCSHKDIMEGLDIPAPGGNRHWDKRDYVDVIYQHPDGKPRIAYREDCDGPCWRDDCEKTGKHKHTWVSKGLKMKGTFVKVWHLPEDAAETVLIVCEGGKTARALCRHVEGLNYAPVTWYGGAGTADHSDWSTVKGFHVKLWPDNDGPSKAGFAKVARAVRDAGALSVSLVDVEGLPHKADAADVDRETALKLLQDAKPEVSEIPDGYDGFAAALDGLGWRIWHDERGMRLMAQKGSNGEALTFEDAIAADAVDNVWIDSRRTEIELRHLFARRRKNDDIYHVTAKFNAERTKQYLRHQADGNRHDLFKLYLEELPPWDGTRRISRMIPDLLGGVDLELAQWGGLAIVLGAIVRTYEPGAVFDQVPVIVGPQGIGKSSFLKTLIPYEKFFTESVEPGQSDKEVLEATEQTVIAEFPELAGVERRQLERLKAFITKTADNARKAWGFQGVMAPRRWVGIATANPTANGILPFDETGQRRWGIVRLDADKAQDHDFIRSWVAENRDQIWAEGLHDYREVKARGEQASFLYRMPEASKALAAELADEHSQRNEQARDIACRLTDQIPLIHNDSGTSLVELMQQAGLVGEDTPESEAAGLMAMQKDLARELRAAGWTKRNVGRKKRARWFRPA